jgi:hypothetical protein
MALGENTGSAAFASSMSERWLRVKSASIPPSMTTWATGGQDVVHRHSDDAGDGKGLRPAVFCVADAHHVRWNEIEANDDQAALKSLMRASAKGWNTILRLCSPLEAYFIKTGRPGELELVQ